MNFIRKHQKAVFIAGLAIIFLVILAYWQRQITLSNATATKLKDEPRNSGEVVSTFYCIYAGIAEVVSHTAVKMNIHESRNCKTALSVDHFTSAFSRSSEPITVYYDLARSECLIFSENMNIFNNHIYLLSSPPAMPGRCTSRYCVCSAGLLPAL